VSQVLQGGQGLPPLAPQASTLSYTVDQVLGGDCAVVKMQARFNLGQGIPPSEVNNTWVFGSAMLCGLWAPPDALRVLRQGQVLDEDPVTHYRASFAGIQGNIAVMAEQGPTDLLEQSYDLTSGLLVGSRYTQQQLNIGQVR